MTTSYAVRYAAHPDDVKRYNTSQLREAFLLEDLFQDDMLNMVYSHYDRFIVGGVKAVTADVALETIAPLKATYFLERREIGIINVGGPAKVSVNGKTFLLESKEALYVGKGNEKVIFHAAEQGPAFFYLNAAPAHTSHPVRKISLLEAETVETGSPENSNHRVIRKLIVNSILPTCQLQMGLTELQAGSVWNTMPPHVHDRRMEAYFYFDLPKDNVVCHFMGEPQETRHLWVKDKQAIISPPWSIHSGAGSSNYSFIWGMAGENLDYSDMDGVKPIELR